MGEHVNVGIGIVVEDPLAGGRVVLPRLSDEIAIGEQFLEIGANLLSSRVIRRAGQDVVAIRAKLVEGLSHGFLR